MPNLWGAIRLATAAVMLAALSIQACAKNASGTALPRDGAREDLELAISAVEAAIPNLYWHQTRAHWEAAKEAARERVVGARDSEALWRILRPLVSQIGEGHLGLQLSGAMNARYREALRFPLDLLWTQQGAFVVAGYGAAADIPNGAKLVSIDGVGEAELLCEMVSVTPHDGAIETGVMRTISERGFSMYLYRLWGERVQFHVVLDTPGGRIDRVVGAVPRTARPPEGDDTPPLPTLEWLGDHTAYLNVPTLSNARFRNAGATFPETIHDVFVELAKRGATDMILDLRENGGGSEPNESILFSYLVEKPLHKYAAVDARGRHIAVTSLSGRVFETDVFEDDDVDQQRARANGRVTRRNTPPHGLMSRWKSFAPLFHGRLVVLAGGNTFSGGAELASMLRHTDRAVFVGEEVGGADEGNTSGYKWTVELPNSGMKLSIPLLQFRMAWSSRPHGRGVRPDCLAPPGAANVGGHRDSAWQEAVALLGRDWRSPRQAVCTSKLPGR